MFVTSIPWVPAHMNEHTTASGKKKPVIGFPSGSIPAMPLALIPAIFTFGATPTMPMSFAAAAMVPAVCVPWPLISFPGRRGAGAPLVQSALLSAS